MVRKKRRLERRFFLRVVGRVGGMSRPRTHRLLSPQPFADIGIPVGLIHPKYHDSNSSRNTPTESATRRASARAMALLA
jgi:hypothetical protein